MKNKQSSHIPPKSTKLPLSTPKNGEAIEGEPFSTTEILALSHEGRGVAKINDKTVFIDGALPGETVKFKYQRRKRRYDEGKMLEVLSPSPDRVTPPCPHAYLCGGCSLQQLDSRAQVLYKQKIVLEQLQHFGGVVPKNILPPILGPTLGYRRRARLGVKFVTKKDELLVGFREKNSGLLADLKQCEVLDPSVGTLFLELKELITSLLAYRAIPQIEVAIGDNQSALVFRHLESLSEQDKTLLIEFGLKHSIYIYLQPAGPESVHRIWPESGAKDPMASTSPTAPSTYLSYKLPEFDIEIQFQPTDFTQVNAQVNRQMVSKVIEYLDLQPMDNVLDLFCGLGNFTLPMARKAAKVVGVEGGDAAVRRAQENATYNGIMNAEFYVENLQNVAFRWELKGREGTISEWATQTYQKILLDPPRTGAHEILSLIASLGATRIVYVSCNPATLARDLGELVKSYGFQLEAVGILDMFPHTTHVESIAVLEKSLDYARDDRKV